MNKSVTVIGAGVAGLASGIRLLNEGYDVTIVERHHKVGGKMSQLEFDGYKFDLGPTIVMMPDLYKEVFELAGRKAEDYIPLERIDPMYSSYFDNGTTRYRATNDLVETMKMLESFNDTDGEGFLKYLSDLYSRFNIAKNHFLQRSFRTKKEFYNPFILSQGLKLKTLNSADNLLKKYIKDDRMRQMIAFQTLYIGISPFKGPSLYTIIPMIEYVYGVWFIRGGMYSMAKGMARLFEEMGGTIMLDSEVERIIIEDGAAKGVEVNQQLHYSDLVMCNADFPYAMKNLIKEPENKGKYTDKYIDDMDYSCSCFVMYFGMDKKYDEVIDMHNFVFSNDLDTNINQIFSGDTIEDPSIYMYIPSKIDPTLAPAGKDGVYVLIPVSDLSTLKSAWTDETSQLYRQKAIDKISKLPGMENFESEVVTEKHMTPNDFDNIFNAYNGATFGLRPTLTQSNHLRPQSTLPNCDNLYFTGSSTHPGAGVPIVLLSAKIAVNDLISDEQSKE